MYSRLNVLCHCPFLGLEWKLTFSNPGATAEFSKFAGILSAALLTALSFRIWNSSAGILSPPLALFIVMFPKAHLTSHSRMSGFRWVNTPSWLSGSLRPFLYNSSVYSCHLFLISCTSVRSLLFLSFIMPILTWNIPLIYQVFLTRCLVFPILFPSISLHCSFNKVFLSSLLFSGTLCSVKYIFPFLPCLLLLFFPQLFVKPLQITTLPSCISFSLGWFWSLPPIQCCEPPSIVFQAPRLPDLIPWIYLSPSLYNHEGIDLVHTLMALWFPPPFLN